MTAARTSVLDDWGTHIQAYTDAAAGKDTRAVSTTTRARGPARADAFADALSAYHRADCSGVPEPCRKATSDALGAANVAVMDWRIHLKAMVDRRSGQLGPYAAHMAWMEMYKSAPKNIEAFRVAEAEAEGVCDG